MRLSLAMVLLRLIDLFGTAVFAVSGVIRAEQEEMDLFGVLVIAAVTAIGGGTIRDLLLGNPVFWIRDTTYLTVIAAASIAAIVWSRFFAMPEKNLLVADAFGLAVFAVLGARAAMRAQAPATVAILMGVITGVAGGVVRDVLCLRSPVILRREIYATAAFAGAGACVALSRWVGNAAIVIGVSIAIGLVLRLAAVRFGLHLPTIQARRVGETARPAK